MADRGLAPVTVDIGAGLRSVSGAGPDEPTLWLNRINALPSNGRPSQVVATAGQILLGLELRGATVINGHRAWSLGVCKAAQVETFRHLGLDSPATIAIDRPAEAVAAADQLGYPVLVKPNVGGSGSGIAAYQHPEELRAAVDAGSLSPSLGADGTGVVQRVVEAADGLVHRIEMLGDELFYGTDQPVQPGVFNYCAADGCTVEQIRLVDPDPELVRAAASVMAAAGADIGGLEYLIDRTTGQPCWFDFNPYSNFVAGRDDELGFDPIDRYLDHALAVAGRR